MIARVVRERNYGTTVVVELIVVVIAGKGGVLYRITGKQLLARSLISVNDTITGKVELFTHHDIYK